MVTPSPTIAEREAAAILQTYGRAPVTFVRGDGCWLYDEDGKDYLDCLAGIAVVSVGHANAAVAAAVARQMTKLVHTSNLYYTVPQVELAERLKALSGLDRVFFANCGATANEAAIKLARRWGQKRRGQDCYEVISLIDSFHGRTLAALAATGQPHKQEVFAPLPPGFPQVPAGDIDAMADAVGPQTAGVLIETTQGEGGVVPLNRRYLHELRELCDEREVLLIFDDVQAGIGRTGSWFSWQQLGVEPDIATLAKALANGLPIGACLSTERAAAFDYGDHATTFGGGPVITTRPGRSWRSPTTRSPCVTTSGASRSTRTRSRGWRTCTRWTGDPAARARACARLTNRAAPRPRTERPGGAPPAFSGRR